MIASGTKTLSSTAVSIYKATEPCYLYMSSSQGYSRIKLNSAPSSSDDYNMSLNTNGTIDIAGTDSLRLEPVKAGRLGTTSAVDIARITLQAGDELFGLSYRSGYSDTVKYYAVSIY